MTWTLTGPGLRPFIVERGGRHCAVCTEVTILSMSYEVVMLLTCHIWLVSDSVLVADDVSTYHSDMCPYLLRICA